MRTPRSSVGYPRYQPPPHGRRRARTTPRTSICSQTRSRRDTGRGAYSIGIDPKHTPPADNPANRQIRSLVCRPSSDHCCSKSSLRRPPVHPRAPKSRCLPDPACTPLSKQIALPAAHPPRQETRTDLERRGNCRPQTLVTVLEKGERRGHLHEPSHNPTTVENWMVRLLPVWYWRIPPIRKSLAGKNPKIEPHLWGRYREQCPQVPWNGCHRLAHHDQMRRTWRRTGLHPGSRRQHVSHWLALQIQQAGARLVILPTGSNDREKLAHLITDSTHCLASQHIQGDQNTVSDFLSFDGDNRGYRHPLAFDSPPLATYSPGVSTPTYRS
jgi:hypothetical protein